MREFYKEIHSFQLNKKKFCGVTFSHLFVFCAYFPLKHFMVKKKKHLVDLLNHFILNLQI